MESNRIETFLPELEFFSMYAHAYSVSKTRFRILSAFLESQTQSSVHVQKFAFGFTICHRQSKM